MGNIVGSHVVPSGEAFAVVDKSDGSVQIIEGPAQFNRRGKEVTRLRRYAATGEDYLEITYQTGKCEIRRGPCAMFEDPHMHANIETRHVLNVAEGEQYALWSGSTFQVVNGPCQLTPLRREKATQLPKFVCSINEYLVVNFANGTAEVVEGPATLYQHPSNHLEIVKCEVVQLKEHERARLTRPNGESFVVPGPTKVIPGLNKCVIEKPVVAQNTEYLLVEGIDGTVTTLAGPISMFKDPKDHLNITVLQKKIIQSGQRAVIVAEDGTIETIEGPASIIPGKRKCVELQATMANTREYLSVQFADGRVQNIPGPTSMFQDPRIHVSITKQNCVELNSGEVIVVYKQREAHALKRGDLIEFDTQGAVRRVVQGPTLFVPAPDEWVHEFQWHGKDPRNPAKKVPGGLKFMKLKLVPEQFYYDVDDVRTLDDALVVCKLMIFVELMDLNLMLDSTSDPIGDFINAVSADVVSFATNLPYEQFVEKTSLLNDLSSYPNLRERAPKIGYKINKVVYRGYEASEELQEMHNQAIEKRTRLRLDGETEEKEQQIQDFRLQKDVERSMKKQQLEHAEQEHKNRLELLALEAEVQRKKAKAEADQTAQRLKYEDESKFLLSLMQMGVDLTTYLTSKEQKAPERLIQIQGNMPLQQKLSL